MTWKLAPALALGIALAAPAAQADGLAATVKAGTLGLGVEFSGGPGRHVNGRAGINYFNYDFSHDYENIDYDALVAGVGSVRAEELRTLTLEIYARGAEIAAECGLILADTKFEFGDIDGRLLLIDEALTPDSSRFWLVEQYQPGRSQQSFDKQPVRDYLDLLVAKGEWNRMPPPPPMPPEVVESTSRRYLKAYELITGEPLRLR